MDDGYTGIYYTIVHVHVHAHTYTVDIYVIKRAF